MWNFVDFYNTGWACDCEYMTLLQLNHSKKCSVVSAVLAKWLEFLFSMAFILSANREKETHFDCSAEDDTIEQWFSNFSLQRTRSFVKVFSIIGKSDVAVS